MAIIKPFKALRPTENIAYKVAALPYDVYSRDEVKEELKKEPLSFLKVDRAEVQLGDNVDAYDNSVYSKAKETLDEMIKDGIFITEDKECLYIYELSMNEENHQTGIVACSSIDDYINNIIKKHENTREDKELDRIRHVDICNAQTGPIFLAYKSNDIINNIINDVKKEEPLYDFTAVDGVVHMVWKIDDNEKINLIKEAFANINSIYIADGHHRAASAVKVGLNRREEREYTGEEEFNFFLSVLFPHNQLTIMSYNRAVKDLAGHTKEEFLTLVKENFEVEVMNQTYNPKDKLNFGMYLDKVWYRLKIRDSISSNIIDSVEKLDVSILQNYLLEPILNIKDPRTDKRIEFIGGIRGLNELEKRVNEDMAVAFSLYPTSITELFSVSDDNKLMPPKSTWFEPKLRSGLFIHKLLC